MVLLKITSVLAFLILQTVHASTIEVLHFWTSPGEANALNVIKSELTEQGHSWKDFAVAGGGGEAAQAALKARIFENDPPTAAEIKGINLKRWATLGYLRDLTQLANEQNWASRLPQAVKAQVSHQDRIVAVPTNIHGSNWIWSNTDLIKNTGMKLDDSWQRFEKIATTLQSQGITPIVHVGAAWQDATLFESILITEAGAGYYRNVFVDLQLSEIKTEPMINTFKRLAWLKKFMLRLPPQTPWNEATRRVIDGEAAMQFMGDWARGEFVYHDKTTSDFGCSLVPGEHSGYVFLVNSLATFKTDRDSLLQAQNALIETVMTDNVQNQFNHLKGATPAKLNLSKNTNHCVQLAATTIQESDQSFSLVPSIAHGMAISELMQQALYDVVHEFMNGTTLTPEEATKLLSKKLRYARYLIN